MNEQLFLFLTHEIQQGLLCTICKIPFSVLTSFAIITGVRLYYLLLF
jgi:hypothetical protein